MKLTTMARTVSLAVLIAGVALVVFMTTTPTPTKTQADNPPILDPAILQDRGVAPELTNTTWINTDKPLRLAALQGKVAVLDFWTFNCINCQHTLPYLKTTYASYKDKGVEFIGVHFPETDYERNIDNLRDYVKQQQITYPITTDNDGATWYAYDMHAWPAFIIVDKAGHIRYRQIGEGNYDTITRVLDTSRLVAIR